MFGACPFKFVVLKSQVSGKIGEIIGEIEKWAEFINKQSIF